MTPFTEDELEGISGVVPMDDGPAGDELSPDGNSDTGPAGDELSPDGNSDTGPAGDELSPDDNSDTLTADAGAAESVTGEQFPTSPDVGPDRATTGYCVWTPLGYLEATFRRRKPTDKMVAELEPPAVWVRV